MVRISALPMGLFIGFFSLMNTSAMAQSEVRYQLLVRSNYGFNQWWPYGGGSYSYAEAINVLQDLNRDRGRNGWTYAGQYRTVRGTQPPPRADYWRSETWERSILTDRNGRRYWSEWKYAGAIELDGKVRVQNAVRNWLELDPYRRFGLIGRWASTPVQVKR